MLVLTAADVEAVLDRDALIEAVADALAELSAGRVSMPPRVAAEIVERDGLLAAMPAYVPAIGALGAKLVTVSPMNAGTRWPTHQAAIVLFDPATGAADALLDGTVLTAARTAAASAVATRLLARSDAAVLTVVGTGVQARAHALTVWRVCPGLSELRVVGRDRAKARALAADLRVELPLAVVDATDVARALVGADVVCLTTHAAEPVIRREWLAVGAHVNSVGFHPAGREVDAATVVAADVFVEARASALAPVPAGSNDLLWPIGDGLVPAEGVWTEIGEVIQGTRPGRTSPDQLTLYKSVGVAVEDVAAASLVAAAARARGLGRVVDL